MPYLVVLLLALALAGAGCAAPAATPEASALIAVHTGTSYGMCMGWCTTSIVADDETAVMTRIDYNPGVPDSVVTRPMDPAIWASLTEAFDAQVFAEADTVYGCPDCADGGTEWISAQQGDDLKRIAFEAGGEVPSLMPFVEAARALNALFED